MINTRRLAISAAFLACGISAHAVCCCDDSSDKLANEARIFAELKGEADAIKGETSGRIPSYAKLLKIDSGRQLYQTKKMNAANMFKDAIGTKEDFELEAAKAAVAAAKIANALTAAEVRGSIGEEAEAFLKKK